EKVRSGRRAGGLSRTRTQRRALPADVADVPLTSMQDLSKFLAESINQVRRGELEPRVANTMGYLAAILLKSLEQGCTEERISRLESTLSKTDVRRFQFIPRGSSNE